MRAISDETQAYRTALLTEIVGHVGEENAIDMGDLYRKVFGREWSNKINDTRALRRLITDLREQGIMIMSCNSGYFISRAASEAKRYTSAQRRKALKILRRVSQIEKISLQGLLGQMQLNLGNDEGVVP